MNLLKGVDELNPLEFIKKLTDILDHKNLNDEQKEIQILILVREESHKALKQIGSDKK